MVREPRGLPAAVLGGARERHMRHNRLHFDPSVSVPSGFVAKPVVPKSKHHTYFEFVENKDKKKKLELEVTTKKDPPPGFAYVPIGNPDLTTACKELSRERDAMIFIVSTFKYGASNHISGQVHRIGHHIRETIVEEAKASLALLPKSSVTCANGELEPIPESQQEYHAQADAALRDLFPRIPNTDRQAIINHSFTRGLPTKGELPVGLCQDIPLARRVQLAVLAHIRHTHTRYDQLLKETSRQNARKVVEQLCLDTLVQWRGDEETGRDQLDEILREVVVISDSGTGDSEDESTDDASVEGAYLDPDASAPPVVIARPEPATDIEYPMTIQSVGSSPVSSQEIPVESRIRRLQRPRSQRRNQRGFKRYRAWEEALRRNRDRDHPQYPIAMDADGEVSFSAHPQQVSMHSLAPVHPEAFGVVAAPHPVTPPPSQDIPLPSIETFSPPSMPPAFVRSVPSRLPLYAPSRDDSCQHEANLPLRSAGMVVPGKDVPYSSRHLQPPMHNHNQYRSFGTDVYSTHGSRQVHHVQHLDSSIPNPSEPWPPYGTTVARRIIMDANRPGERSSPIVMEDRGGFFERVPQLEESEMATLEAPVLARDVRRWSRPLEPYSPRQYATRRDSPLATQDHSMPGVETYSETRESPMISMFPPWRQQHQAGAPQTLSLATNQRDFGAMHTREPACRAEHLSGYPSTRRDVSCCSLTRNRHQTSRGTRDGQYAHGRNRGHGGRSPVHVSPRRSRRNIIVLE